MSGKITDHTIRYLYKEILRHKGVLSISGYPESPEVWVSFSYYVARGPFLITSERISNFIWKYFNRK